MLQQLTQWIDDTRLSVIVGHFGSGKTEFSVNFALELVKKHPTAVADLDVVDPYFRSRECKKLFDSRGIQLISSSQSCVDADVPSMPAEVMRLFDDERLYGVLDIGGDASGARVLARYRRQLNTCGARIICVVNANRPLTNTPEKAISYVKDIEGAVGLPITGLVNNTHLCAETKLEDVLTGARLLTKVSKETGIPIVCHMASEALAQEAEQYVQPVFPVYIYMKKPWE